MKALTTLVLVLGAAASAAAQSQGVTLHQAAGMQWKEGPASLPKGAEMMVLEGDPTLPGPFTLRFKFPKGFQIQPHFHTQTEHATVLAGTIYLGMGERFDRAAMKPMTAGSFGFWPAGTPHFAWTESETILQLHGTGPWTLVYVNPADDPSRRTP